MTASPRFVGGVGFVFTRKERSSVKMGATPAEDALPIRTPLALAAALLTLSGCPTDEPDPAPPLPVLGELVEVVPSPGLPDAVVLQDANNNLDVVEHDGEVFLAFRTAPSHFASAETMLYVVRSGDQQTWTLEWSQHLDTDLREPRLLSHDGRLWLYYAVLGQSVIDFEPQGAMVTERLGPGQWTEPEWVYEEGFIPWRARVIDGTAHLIGYVGGEDIYDFQAGTEYVHWLTTEDGTSFDPVVPGQPVVLEGGASETDFAFLDDGTLVAVARNELGDESGWGSKICRAEAGALGDWDCTTDPKKYDSPLVFKHGERVILVGRRHVTETGHYDLEYRDMDPEDQTLHYLAEYWVEPKRCSIWEVDPEQQAVTFLVDLPSAGDTCFASVLPAGGNTYTLYNYTSDPAQDDLSWIDGQTGPTFIYRIDVTFPDPE